MAPAATTARAVASPIPALAPVIATVNPLMSLIAQLPWSWAWLAQIVHGLVAAHSHACDGVARISSMTFMLLIASETGTATGVSSSTA